MDCTVLGFIMGYGWKDVAPWALSLRESGYTGYAEMVTFDDRADPYMIDRLYDLNIEVVPIGDKYGTQRHTVVVDRFRFISDNPTWLNDYDTFYTVLTDVKDVIFQTDPTAWLNTCLDSCKTINAGGEGLNYIHEPWGCDNIQQSFPFMKDKHKMLNVEIMNAGTIGGVADSIISLADKISLLCSIAPIHNPDQAAYNYVLRNDAEFRCSTQFNNHNSSWACQCGTTMDPRKIDVFRSKLLCPEPVFDGEFVRTSTGEKFCLVHQYDRVPQLKAYFDGKYRSN